MSEMNPRRYEVTAAARGLDVLETLSVGGRPMTVTEVAAASGIPRPTAFRLLATLQERNWVYKDGVYYRLGFKCFQLGAVAGAGLEIRTQALPFLVELRDLTDLNAQIAKLEDWRVVYLERVLARRQSIVMPSRAGAILPAHCTALGKMLLASKDLETVAAWATRVGLKEYTSNTIVTTPDLIAELLKIRSRGYSIERGEREPHITCVAAPVTDANGEVVAAVSVAGPASKFPAPLLGSDLTAHVVETAARISRAVQSPQASSAVRPLGGGGRPRA